MNTATPNKTNPAQKTTAAHLLNADTNSSLQTLIRISQKLIDFADQEARALAINDYLGFAFTQQDKEKLARQYAQASEEFRSRVEEFRTCDSNLLSRLDRLQNQLKEKTQSNNDTIARIRDRALANTKSTLFSAQELGQRLRIHNNIEENGE